MYKRLIDIVDDLSENKKLKIDDISEKYHVTNQTIRNDINNINELLNDSKRNNIGIDKGEISCPPDFYYIKRYINDVLKHTTLYTYRMSKEELSDLTIIFLLFQDNVITINELSSTLYVGRTTFINRLPHIKKYAESLGLSLLSSPNKGLTLNNDELSRRKALIKIIEELIQDNEFFLNLILKTNIVTTTDYRRILDNIINAVQKEIKVRFASNISRALVYYLNFMVSRMESLDYVSDSIKTQTGTALQLSFRIMEYISYYCNVPRIKSEGEFLTYLLGGVFKYESILESCNESIPLQILTNILIENVSDDLNIDLTDDFELYENLSNHLIMIYNSNKQDMVQNDILTDILANQKKLIDIIKKNIFDIEAYYKRILSEVEIIYIVIYFSTAIEKKRFNNYVYRVIIACNSGVAVSQLIKVKLAYFSNIEVVKTIDSHEIHNIKPDDADLLISAVKIFECPIEFINVSTSIDNDDLVQISNKIREMYDRGIFPKEVKKFNRLAEDISDAVKPLIYKYVDKDQEKVFDLLKEQIVSTLEKNNDNYNENEKKCAYQLLTPTYIKLDYQCNCIEDAIKEASKNMISNKYFTEKYLKEMIDVTIKYGPYYIVAPGVAMPHGMPGVNSHKLGMSLIRLKNDIVIDTNSDIHIKYLIVLSIIDKESHLKALFHIISLFKDKLLRQELDACKTSFDVNKLLYDYEKRINKEY